MTTQAKVTSNQANAKLSSGPSTPEGKATSSLNAVKHGLTADTVLLPGEDPVVYQCFTDGMLDAFCPLNTAEKALVLEMVDVQWRIRRGSRFEARILSVDNPDMKALNNIGLHTSRLKRQYSATLKEFQNMHRENQTAKNQRLATAEQIFFADQILDRPSTLARFGFDFTLEELERWLECKGALVQAKEIITGVKYEQGDEPSVAMKAAA